MLLPRLIICFIVGIAIADVLFEVVSGVSLYLFSGAVCVFLLSVFCRHRRRIFCCAIGGAFFLLGAALLMNEREVLQVAWSGEEQVYCATQVADVREKERSYQATALIDGHKVRLTLQKDSLSVPPVPNGNLLLHTRVTALRNPGNPGEFDYARYLHRQGFTGTAYCGSGEWQPLGTEVPTSLSYQLSELRQALSRRLETYLDGRPLEVVSAMTLGNKQFISAETRLLYTETGASHVLALSGLHLSILFALFNLLLLRPLRAFRSVHRVVQIVFILAVWGFVAMVGAPLSLMRAALMLTLIQFSLLLQRGHWSLHNLALAALILLIWSPQSLFDVGFQLSFMAVWAIVVVMPHLPRWTPLVEHQNIGWRLRRWTIDAVQDLLRVSLAAQIGTLPLVLYYFHVFPTYSLLVSFWIIPLAGVVLGIALLFFLLPSAASLFGPLLREVVELMNEGLAVCSHLPFASFELPITLVTAVVLYLLPLLAIWGMGHFRRHKWMLLGLAVCIISIGGAEYWALQERKTARERAQVLVYNVRNAMAVHVVLPSDASYLWTSDSVRTQQALRYVADTYWRSCGWTSPSSLQGDTLLSALKVCGSVMQVGSYRIARVGHYKDAPLPSEVPATPLKVDALCLQRGVTHSLSHIMRYYAPSTVVLDASLSQSRRKGYIEEAEVLKIPVFDVAERGAWVVTLE